MLFICHENINKQEESSLRKSCLFFNFFYKQVNSFHYDSVRVPIPADNAARFIKNHNNDAVNSELPTPICHHTRVVFTS